MLKKITNGLMVLAMSAGVMASSIAPAEAGRRHSGIGLGIAAGIIGLGVLSAATAHAGPRYYSRYEDDEVCYRGPRECHWSGRHCFENRYGDLVCRGGRYVCERPLVCD